MLPITKLNPAANNSLILTFVQFTPRLWLSGLDSTAATFLTETLRSLADSGKTIVAVIHQPSQHVFAAFDDLLLVSEGKQMYFGEVSKVRKHMESHGFGAPSEMRTYV